MSQEQDDYREDEERDEFAPRSVFAAGWFRAVLVLTVLAIVVVISLPYLLNWFEPPPPARVSKPADTSAPSAAPPATATAPMPTPEAPQEAKAAPSPAAPPPARKAVAERPPVKPAERAAPTRSSSTPAKSSDRPPTPAKVAKAETSTSARPASVAAPKSAIEPAPAGGKYWVQLGAFKEQQNADALAKTLRDAGFPVQVEPIAREAGGGKAASQHELFVAGASAEKVNAALKGRGTAQAVSGGVAVRPAFGLQEAMTVSRHLTDEGLKVVIRPAGGAPGTGAAAGTLHAVRAGGYPNRSSALAARNELLAKGHKGFLTEGPAK